LGKQGADYRLEVEAAPEILRYVIFKGSIAVDGISLTVAKVSATRFAIWIIPTRGKRPISISGAWVTS